MSKRRQPRSPKGDYSIGYGRPPVHSRFKPGQSGNPNGRPKGKNRQSIVEDLEAVLAERIPMRSPRGQENVPLRRAFFWTLLHDAVTGDKTARKLVLSLLQAQLAREVEDRQEPSEAATQENPGEDQELLRDFLRRHADKADDEVP